MKKTNKLISILLVIAMLLSMAPLSLTAFATSPVPYDGVPVTPQVISSGNYAKLGLTDTNWSQFNGYYAIRNAKELYGFADIVNNTSAGATINLNAVLLQDIVINANGGNTYDWRPLYGTGNDRDFEGTIDGNGHYISGIYCTLVTKKAFSNDCISGFIGEFSGTVKNLIIKDSTFAPPQHIGQFGGLGAITGYPKNCTIENCRVENTKLIVPDNYGQIGGLTGYGNGLGGTTIKNCVSLVTISGGGSSNPISVHAPYTNCYTSADATHTCANISVEHKEVKATCEYPGLSNYKYCLVCGNVTSGTKTETPATHIWENATCTEPQTCSYCGETQGDALGHKNLRYIINTFTGRHAEYRCDVCGTVGTVTLSSQNVDYDGNHHGATVAYTGDFPEVTINYENRSTGEISTEAPTEAGQYEAYVVLGAYRLASLYIINKHVIEDITAPAPNTLIYSGKAQALVSAGEANGGELQYSLDSATYSAEIPTGTDAGDYTIYYKVVGDNNHKDTEPATQTVTIKKKAVTVTADDMSKTYGEADPEDFTFSYNLDNAQYKLNGQPERTPGENVGVYAIGQGTLTNENNPNYDITFVGGLFTIEPDKSGIEVLTVENVKSTDKENVEYVYNQLENAVKDLADEEKKTEWNTLQASCGAMLAVISDTADEISRIVNAVNAYDINTVTGDDVQDLLGLIDDANALLETDNLTAEETETLNQAIKDTQSLISRYDRVSAQIGDIKDRLNNYDEATVKSSDKDDVIWLKADIKSLTDGQNITNEEREYFKKASLMCDKLLAKIAETKSEYDRVIAAANGYDEATVTSADKDALVKLNDDIYALALTENVTAEEKENLQAAHDKVLGLIDKLVDISDEIKRIIAEVDKYVFESVKSSDKSDIQQLIADIKALLDTQNITADERALLEGADETCDKLIAKIDETVAEISRINDATNAYDEATVTSADKADIEKLLADIKALTDGDNITDAEREQLVDTDETLDKLLAIINETAEEIARIETAVNGYDEESVKSTDKANLEQLIEDIKALTDATNITEDEKAALEALDEKADALIKKIDDTAKEIEKIENAVNGYDEETVKSSDISALGKLIEDIKALTDGDNLTEDENAALEEADKAIDELIEKLTEVAEEIKRVDEAVKSYDEEAVKSTDSDELSQLKEDVQSLIDSDNVTENEKTALEDMIADIENLEAKIEETEKRLEDIGDFEESFNPETVTSDDKTAIEDKIAEIEAVNPDNLTDEQKAEYEEIKAGFEALLEEIAAAEKDVADIGIEHEMFDEERVTIFWEDDIEALKAKIDELLADENMGEAENTKLNEYKIQAEKLIEIINTPKEYFSLRFFYFIWDCLVWKHNDIVWLFKQIFAC